MSDCLHEEWGRTQRGQPLHCLACGVHWPGYRLPVPPPRHAGYGSLTQQPSWRSRVDAMTSALEGVG